MNKQALIESALGLSERYPVIPCNGKKSVLKGWQTRPLQDAAEIRHWFAQPTVNTIAVPTGVKSGLTVVDIDTGDRKPDGASEKASGFLFWNLITPLLTCQPLMHSTPSGGLHAIFKHKPNQRNRQNHPVEGVDIRGEGGYIIFSGEGYSPINEVEPPELPEFLAKLLSSPLSLELPPEVSDGHWHEPVLKWVARQVSRGAADQEILLFADHLTTPSHSTSRTDEQLKKMIDGARNKGFGRHANPPPPAFKALIKEFVPDWQPPELPDNCIPQSLIPIVNDISSRLDVPREFALAPMLVIVSSLIGRRAHIQPKANDTWKENAGLWGAIVAEPGELKSPTVSQALKPLRALERESQDAWKTERLSLEMKLTLLEQSKRQRLDELKKEGFDLSELNEEIDDPALLQLLESIANIEKRIKNGPRRFYVNDSTVEQLQELLKAHPYGLLQFRDELSGFFQSLTKSGREDSRAFFLEAWSGKGDFNVDRINRGHVHIRNVSLMIFGTIQPELLKRLLVNPANSGEADGFAQRFQIMFWPGRTRPRQWVDLEPNRESTAAYQRLITGLANSSWKRHKPDLEEGIPWDGIPTFRLSAEAQILSTSWLTDLERRIYDEPSSAFRSVLGKQRGLMPRIALNNHVLRLTDGFDEIEIERDSVQRAIALCEHLEAHARKIWCENLNAPLKPAELLKQRILDGDLVNGMSVREIYKAGWSGLKEPALVKQEGRPDEAQASIAFNIKYKLNVNSKNIKKYFANMDLMNS